MKGHVFNFRKRRVAYENLKKITQNSAENGGGNTKTLPQSPVKTGSYKNEYQPKTINNGTFEELRQKLSPADAIAFVKANLLYFAFGFVILVGIFWGAAVAKGADRSLALSLDFLFTTNLQARLAHGFFETFCACFASNFMFLLAVYVFAAAPWGCAAVPLILFFKGFGVGLCAGHLYIQYGLKGLGFYVVVLLLGIFIFSVALVVHSKNAFNLSKRFVRLCFFKKSESFGFAAEFKNFTLKSAQVLIFAAFSALVDTVLWSVFAPLFNF
ncbi:MAG: stage II sporulation protein M [Oscillospiraceae bacterium]|nr:stage II sporulation protein M [Oscillospiraceae bacterium]